MPALAIPGDLEAAYASLRSDLQAVFGPRLEAAVAFGPRLRAPTGRATASRTVRGDSLVLVDRVAVDDLMALGAHAERWHQLGLRMPLLLGREEFRRSLDAFPLEYDDIIAHHVPLVGHDPLGGVKVAAEDLRRACEGRAKGHLVHLREGFLEARGRPAAVANLILASASPFSALLGNLARLQRQPSDAPDDRMALVAQIPGVTPATVGRILALEQHPLLGADEGARLYPEYLEAVERLVAWVDGWAHR